MTDSASYFADLHALDWQIDLGADEAIQDTPVNRYETVVTPARGAVPKTGPNSNIKPVDVMPVIPQIKETGADIARIMAGRCNSLADLRDALAVFEHCTIKKGARNLVLSEGHPNARVMIIGEAPSRDEDRSGAPFIGESGKLLDRMFAAIGLSRKGEDPSDALYLTNLLPWRVPQNRDPNAEEIAMMLPFLERHIALVDPDIIVPLGNIPCKALLGKTGITRLRGTWAEAFGKPVLPMFHPAALFRDPLKKRDCWADLLDIKARLSQ
ncbi:uracil-DNA glycosylase [Neptunicoccus cionae]|uniref:uracil-DNA glycosylase n=1 Tax=Neptunicoccus cionae TaxID=2035344 RepID=UPI000C787B29|nr:uracil-DNA glycosylase [Amylibacter cionae]PLS23268.1 uracil-DNA glycosylase [Amylibacter cionae]